MTYLPEVRDAISAVIPTDTPPTRSPARVWFRRALAWTVPATACLVTLAVVVLFVSKLHASHRQTPGQQRTATQARDLRRLNQALDLARYRPVYANATPADSSSAASTLRINAGAAAGITIGDPVLEGHGLIGEISSVAPNSSVITGLMSARMGVEVRVTVASGRSYLGVLEASLAGSPTGRFVQIRYLNANAKLKKGAPVVTAGYITTANAKVSSRYPSGIPVGVISSIDPQHVPTVTTGTTGDGAGEVEILTRSAPTTAFAAFQRPQIPTDLLPAQLASGPLITHAVANVGLELSDSRLVSSPGYADAWLVPTPTNLCLIEVATASGGSISCRPDAAAELYGLSDPNSRNPLIAVLPATAQNLIGQASPGRTGSSSPVTVNANGGVEQPHGSHLTAVSFTTNTGTTVSSAGPSPRHTTP